MMSQDASGSSESNLVRYPYRRGAKVVGVDGQMVGTLEQLVVDRDSGVLRSLIVRSADGAREFELPEEHVSQNEGDRVRLSVGADELAANPKLARPYNPREFQPVPPGEPAGHGQASRVALQTGQPVVASVGDNAADVVAPELPDAPSGNGSVAAHEAGPRPRRHDDSTAQKMTSGAPDVAAGVPALSDAQEAAPAYEGAPPPQIPSATENTTGELIGGKPSTGGMGSASVAPVHSYPQDASPAPTTSPGESDHTADRGTVEPLPASGAHPEFSSPDAPSAHEAKDEGLRSNQGASPSSQDMSPPATAAEQSTPVTSPLAPSPPVQMQLPSWAMSGGVLATGISLGTGALAGVMMRRRQLRAERATKGAQRTLTDTLQAAGEQARGAAAPTGAAAAPARRQAARSAKRAAKSGRWFRRGVLLGAALGILFAPLPGARLRERLREGARQRFTHGA